MSVAGVLTPGDERLAESLAESRAEAAERANAKRFDTIPVCDIRLDGDTQPRAQIEDALVYEYCELYESGTVLPPIVVFFDGVDYWLVDGFHRWHAARQAKLKKIACTVLQGTLEEARWFSYATNKDHGLRRRNEDKRKAVLAALRHPNGTALSDGQIAEHVGVSQPFVSKVRRELATQNDYESTIRTGRDGRTIDTSKIGRSKTDDDQDNDADDDQSDDEPPHAVTADDYYTNRRIIACVQRLYNGVIDLDPASCATANATVEATRFYSREDDGLAFPWQGKVWLNPPFSQWRRWAPKVLDERQRVDEMCVLSATRTIIAQYFAPLLRAADAVCFFTGRIPFEGPHATSSPDDGHAVFYFGSNRERFWEVFDELGAVFYPPHNAKEV